MAGINLEPADAASLSLSGLSHRCAEESERFFKRKDHDPRYCYELFRRAVIKHDHDAWELIYQQYQPLISGWVERHALFPALDEESQFFVNYAFEKMWYVLTPEKFSRFPDLKSILRYFQMCVHSVIVDAMRSREQAELLEDNPGHEQAMNSVQNEPGLEDQVLAQTQADQLWHWLGGRLKNEKERRVVYGSFVLALKPAEVFALYPGAFSSVRDVYLVKDNLLARLRRDDEFKKLVGDL